MIKIDVKTNIHYIDNIPQLKNRKGRVSSIQTSKGFFKVFAQNHSHQLDSWYNDEFIGDNYAVFKWVNTAPNDGFYQQITPWYKRCGYAEHIMCKMARDW